MTKKEEKTLKKNEKNTSENITSRDTKDIELIRRILEDTENNIQKLKHILFTQDYKRKAEKLDYHEGKEGKIIEGVFDGENMITKDGKKFPVPPNYSSKSKLVSGDLLKLTVIPDGSFVFKQIGPVERKKIIGELMESDDRYFVKAENKNYNVLLASVTYYKLKSGDKVTIIVPKGTETDWAAIENIIDVNKK